MAALTVQTILNTGVVPTYAAAAAAGDSFINNGRTFLHYKNGHATLARTVTIDSLVACNQGSDHNLVVSIPALSEKMIGPLEMSRFNSSTGAVAATYSSEADLTVAAISL